MIGVSALTGIVLEERVALEACRVEVSTEHALRNLRMIA